MNKLKKEYYNQDVLTDTISFNLNAPEQPVEGEIYLSGDRIQENAHQFNVEVEYELANVLIHSILHLLGYDDTTQSNKNQMFEIQNRYLEEINFQGLLKTKEQS